MTKGSPMLASPQHASGSKSANTLPVAVDVPSAKTAKRILKRMQNMVRKSEPSDETEVRKITHTFISLLEVELNSSSQNTIQVLLECGAYYQNIGIHKESEDILINALFHAEKIGDQQGVRRAHNLLGVVYMRLCNFTNASKHMSLAYSIAKALNDPVATLAASSNTVAILISMGLLRDARDLALKVINQPSGNMHLDYLHLLNANNGMKVCHALGDIDSAEIFYRVAIEKIKSANSITNEITRAYHEAAVACHLAKKGLTTEGSHLIEAATSRVGMNTNLRISISLLTAQAEVNLALADDEKIERSRKILNQLLLKSCQFPDKYEEILRALIKISAKRNDGDYIQSKIIRNLARLFRDHVLNVKHRILYLDASRELLARPRENVQLVYPSYSIPVWINQVRAVEKSSKLRRSSARMPGAEVHSIPIDVLELAKFDEGQPFRTEQFTIAESWAVAVDFSTGGTGRRCFQVGKLAAAIAYEIDLDAIQVQKIELACRLYDIGKIVFLGEPSCDVNLRPFGQFSLACQHVSLGAAMLMIPTEEVLNLASIIAKNHHEWWNGCGYPSGLKGDFIPLEARICAIADTFISLIKPTGRVDAWDLDTAIGQIHSMAGFQLDPGLVLAFTRVFRSVSASLQKDSVGSKFRLEEDDHFAEAK